MEDMRRCLERQERETNERSRRLAERQRLQREKDEQVVITVALLDEENQGHRRGSQVGHGSNVDRHRHSRGKNLLENYFIPTSLDYDVDFRRRYRMQSHLFNKVMHDICNYDAYFGQKCDAAGVLGLFPEQTLTAIIRIMAYGSSAGTTCADLRPGTSNNFYKKIETRGFPGMIGSIDCMHWQGDYGNRKGQKSIILEAVVGFDTWVWYAFFGVFRSQNDLNVLGQSPVFNDVLREVYEPNPMKTTLTRIYERPMGPSGEPLEYEPLVRDGRFMTCMIDRYTEMQSSYIHERRQVDLMEYLWAVKGNDGE
ncbi:unnamed protein product [Prunus armeniaca]